MKAENVIGPVSLSEKPVRSYFGIRFATPFEGLFAVVTRELKVLRKWVNEQKLADQGPFFLRYYVTDMKGIMDVEVGFVTASPVQGTEAIRPGQLPPGRYATLLYRGNGLRGNQALMRWAQETGTRFDGPEPSKPQYYVCRYEAYLTDYRVEPRKLLWDVELSIKLADD